MNRDKIKMIVSDLDGTLLSSTKEISEIDLATMIALKNKNILITIASGRPLKSILLNLKKWKIDKLVNYIIHTNGYGIFNCSTGIDQTFYTMDSITCSNIIERYFKSPGLSIIDYDGLSIKTTKINRTVLRIQSYNNAHIQLVDTRYFKEHIFPKLMFSGHDDDIDSLAKDYKQGVNPNDTFKGFKSSSDIFEFIDYHLSKNYALQKLLKSIQLYSNQIIVFGDSQNDLEVLCNNPNSVAMANAPDEIKALATYCTTSNDNSGFSYFLNTDILKGGY